jgi:hypothetical protein
VGVPLEIGGRVHRHHQTGRQLAMTPTPAPVSENARTLAAYFAAFDSADEATWERAFDATWHPEGLVDGTPVAEFKELKRGLLGKVRIDGFEVLRDLDPDRFEYRTTVNGVPTGVNVALFRDGRVYRISHAG